MSRSTEPESYTKLAEVRLWEADRTLDNEVGRQSRIEEAGQRDGGERSDGAKRARRRFNKGVREGRQGRGQALKKGGQESRQNR
jgi:hypothetical protein